ncbi:EcoKI restriction-modification system protein HsdS [Streptococcus parauberis]|nr:EcoKI restriction-modification system protein HsdS [Streptococcus parauberis]
MISVMDILDEQPIKYETIRNSVEVDRKIELKNKVEYGDLVFVRSSEVSEEVGWAKAYLEKEYALYSGFSIRGKKIKEFNPHFVELSLNSVNRKQIERKAGGSTRFNVSQNVMNSLEVLMPKFEEQNKIDRLFKQLDDTIALHQRKIEQLNTLKKGYLQQLFPRNDEKMPRVRFANFEGGWEERKLGEILKKNTRKNKNLSVTNVESISNKTGFTRQTEQFEDYFVASSDLSNYYIIDEKKFAYNPSRINVGSIAYKAKDEDKSVVSPLYVSFSTNKDLDDSFLWYWFKTQDFEHQRQIFSEGGVRDTLSFNQLAIMSLSVPEIEEQQKIGSLIKQLDNLLDDNQQKLEKLNLIKKSYLQKMFI